MPFRLPDDVARTIVDPRSYAAWDELHETLKNVRREYPLARAEIDDYAPFWVAAKYNDIQEVARRNDVFLSGQSPNGMPSEAEEQIAVEVGIRRMFRSVVSMNEPEHTKYRQLTQAWFQPKNLRQLEDGMRILAKYYVDKLAARGGECDFCSDVARYYPLRVIMSVLGVPKEDEPFMLRLTQEFFGAKDEERNRAKVSADPLVIVKAVQQVVDDANEYFRKISDDRRRKPANDLASVIANSQIDGRPIDDLEAMGYYITIAFAGHDTTSSSIAGGIWALCERPDQLKLVQSDLSLIPALVEEAIRWTTPIHQFVRVAAETCLLRGRRVTKGDRVILCFPSGNRDEEVFEDPFAFRVDRKPNRHIGFGYGPHICLGMFLARMEMSIFFQELLPRIEWMELTGEPKRMVSNFVGGPKFVPIRIKMRR